MPAIKKAIGNEKDYHSGGVTDDKVKDRSNDPYFIKKAEDAKDFLRKSGLKGLPDQSKK
jgi:hypothetical protein